MTHTVVEEFTPQEFLAYLKSFDIASFYSGDASGTVVRLDTARLGLAERDSCPLIISDVNAQDFYNYSVFLSGHCFTCQIIKLNELSEEVIVVSDVCDVPLSVQLNRWLERSAS